METPSSLGVFLFLFQENSPSIQSLEVPHPILDGLLLETHYFECSLCGGEGAASRGTIGVQPWLLSVVIIIDEGKSHSLNLIYQIRKWTFSSSYLCSRFVQKIHGPWICCQSPFGCLWFESILRWTVLGEKSGMTKLGGFKWTSTEKLASKISHCL